MNAMTIYEESDFGRQAGAFLHRTLDRADAGTQWRVRPWRMDMLHWAPTALEALRDAVKCDLLVLALRHEAGLPLWFVGWLETWAARREVQDAALAVVDGGRGEKLSTAAPPELRDFAQRQGLNFIFGEVNATEELPAAPSTSPPTGNGAHPEEAAGANMMGFGK